MVSYLYITLHLDTFLSIEVMTSPDSFLEAEMEQQASEIIERDICVRCAPKNLVHYFFVLSHKPPIGF